MKNKNLLFPLALIAMSFSLESQAQISITQSNFPRPASFIDSFQFTNQAGIKSPTEGADQVWDYSSLKSSSLFVNQFLDASTNTNFANSLNYTSEDLSFQGLPVPSDRYEAIDKDGWYYLGRSIQDVIYSLATITGDANDSLHFIENNDKFDGRINLLKFPMTYGDNWSESRNEFMNFELTVSGFGINKTPGFDKKHVTDVRKVVGYGKLTIPNADGSASLPMDALLIKSTQTIIDSFYLGGAPAPKPIMDAFGLTQGSSSTTSFYIFYKADYGFPVLNVNLDENNNTTGAAYRTKASEPTSSVNSFTLTASTTYPNPIEAGQLLNIQIQSPLNTATISIYSIEGRLVSTQNNINGNAGNFQMEIPKNLAQGLYMIQMEDNMGNPISKGKLLVK